MFKACGLIIIIILIVIIIIIVILIIILDFPNHDRTSVAHDEESQSGCGGQPAISQFKLSTKRDTVGASGDTNFYDFEVHYLQSFL